MKRFKKRIEKNYLEMINRICFTCQEKCKQFASVQLVKCPNYHKKKVKCQNEKKEVRDRRPRLMAWYSDKILTKK